MVNIKKTIQILKKDGFSFHSLCKILYETQTHFLLLNELNSKPKITNPAINIDYLILSKDNYREHKQYIRQIATMMIDDPITIEDEIVEGSECIIGLLDKKIVGYVWIHYKEYKPKGIRNTLRLGRTKAYTGPDFVAPLYRGNKIHGALLSRTIFHAYENGYSKIYSSVKTENKSSIKGLIGIGYRHLQRPSGRNCSFL